MNAAHSERSTQNQIMKRGVLLASAGLVFLQLVVLILYEMSILSLDLSRWAAAFAVTIIVQAVLWLIPHFGWNARLRWDRYYVYLPTAAAAGLLILYTFAEPEARMIFLMAWIAALLFIVGLVGFWGVVALGSIMAAGYIAAVARYASHLAVPLPTMDVALAVVFLIVNVFAGVVFERLRRQRDERAAIQRDRLRAEEAARSGAELYQRLFDGVPIGLYSTTPDGRILAANPAMALVLGYPSPEALMAAEVSDIYADPGDRRHWLDLMERDGVVRGIELKLRRRDGQIIWVRDYARTVRDTDGRVLSFEGSLEDITARMEAEEALRQANDKLKVWVSDLERRTSEISVLGKMGELLQACSNMVEAHSVIAHSAQKLFPGEPGALCMQSASRNFVEVVASWGEEPSTQRVFSPDDCWALRRGRAHVVEDTAEGPNCKHLSSPLPQAYLCLPLVAHGEAMGLLCLTRPGTAEGVLPPLLETRKIVASTMGEQSALALANLRLRETLRSQSVRDPLTGLFNRRYMEETLEREIRRAERSGRPLSVMMLDLDHFKQFNDTFGHSAGDALLRELGGMLRANLRAGDIACRFGGEEFVLILPEAAPDCARTRAEQFREAAKHLHVSHLGESLGPVTVSLGVAAFPEHGTSGEALLEAADAALYRAKSEGRDRVVAAAVPA
ncbi:MAG: diguanylate cyclase [bacterium]|nr:diguanylate cyclase [bacterium]